MHVHDSYMVLKRLAFDRSMAPIYSILLYKFGRYFTVQHAGYPYNICIVQNLL